MRYVDVFVKLTALAEGNVGGNIINLYLASCEAKLIFDQNRRNLISCFSRNLTEEFYFLGCDAMLSCTCLPSFQRRILSQARR
jgi:hypothetical protein